ncbi:MAG: M48 family metallopeptidase [Crocinitomicaceae bacterium]
MKSFKYIFILLILVLPSYLKAQDSTRNITLKEIKEEIRSEADNFQPNPELNKEQNALLKKEIKEKYEYEIKLLDTNHVFSIGIIHDLAQTILNRLLISNPSIPQNTRIVVNRTNDYNAFTMGDNVIFVNLGLLYRLRNEDEIALVLAHELAHNMLNHVLAAMANNVIRETDPEVKKQLREILRSKYGVVTALNELMIPRIFESREESRNHEFEADSLGYIYMKNAGYNNISALGMFKYMDALSKNIEERLDLTSCIAINEFPNILAKEKGYSRESSMGFTKEKDTTDLESYLSTHPYDIDRFHRLAKQDGLNMDLNQCLRNVDSNYQVKFKSISEESIQTALKEKDLTLVFYYLCKYVEDFPEDTSGYEMMTTFFESLAFLKERRVSGKYLRLQDPEETEAVDHLAYFLYSLSPKECIDLSKKFKEKYDLKSLPNDAALSLSKMLNCLADEKYELFYLIWLDNEKMVHASNYGWILDEIKQYLYISKKVKQITPNKK